MPYLGNNPTANFASVTKDTFSGNASTTAFTLSKPATTNGVAVYVENVRQIPTTAYAVSGTTLTFTGAPPSGTNNIYVMHHNTPVSTATHPSAQALTATSGTFSSAVTINTTDTNFDVGADDLIVGSGSGDSGITIYTGSNVGDKGSIFFADSTVGSSAEKKGQISYEQNNEIMTFLTNDTLAMQIALNGAVTKPLQPRLSVYQYSAQTISHNTYTKLKLDGTDSITNGFTGWTQSNTHTRWTTATAGTYRIHASMRWYTNSAISTSLLDIYLNGSRITFGYDHTLDNYSQLHAMTIHDLSANDYLEVVVYQYSGGDVAMNGGSANLVRLTADLIA